MPAGEGQVRPVFILSLPRSGSTLLQRMLASHHAIASAAEPWILLPVASMCGMSGLRTYSAYSSRLARQALDDLLRAIPDGRKRLVRAVHDMVMELYGGMCDPETRYFVDKTPRYYLIVDFLADVFPEARFVFLFRHPLDVLSSMLTTWADDVLRMHHFYVDCYAGPRLLHAAHRRYGDKASTVYYERLVTAPDAVCRELADFLDVPFESAMYTGYSTVRLEGTMGDPTRDTKYSRPEVASVGRWKTTLATPVRRAYARRYVRRLGRDVLETFGVSLDDALRDLDTLSVRWRRTFLDGWSLGASWVARRIALNVVREQWHRPSDQVYKLD